MAFPARGRRLGAAVMVSVGAAWALPAASRTACLAERRRIGRFAFRLKYGVGPLHRYALLRCILLAGA